MECVHARAVPRRWINPVVQQVLRNAGPAKETRTTERLGQRLRLIAEESLIVPFDDPRPIDGKIRPRAKPRRRGVEAALLEHSKCLSEFGVFLAK